MKKNKTFQSILKVVQEININVLLLILVVFFGVWLTLLSEPLSMGQAYNTTGIVNTTLNITNSAPLVLRADLDTPIDLIAYYNKTVFCNATVFDYDNDTLTVNATIFIENVTPSSSPDQGNKHYSNTTCTRITKQDMTMNYTCSVPMLYYANNDTRWRCNITVIDSGHATKAFTSNLSNTATVNPLVAIKLPSLLNYGDLAVNDISNDTIANVTNAGNRDTNISVLGYAQIQGDGLSFVCSFGTIPINLEHYSGRNGTAFAAMTPITLVSAMIPTFYVPQRKNDTFESINATYWKVQIPVAAGGVCNGKLLFTASDRGN